MMDTYGSILIVAYQQSTLKTILDQLREIRLHDYFELEARIVDELSHSSIREDALVLVSSEVLLPMIKPYLSEDTPYIIAKRTVNFSRIREILEIPKDKKVMLVSNMKKAVEEIDWMFKETGIHLNSDLYYPGADYDPAINIAITPGESHHVPPGIEKIIDMGSRFIDISSIFEIYIHFQVPNIAFNQLSARYIQSLVHVTSEFSQEILTTKHLRNTLEQTVRHIDDAVLLFTKDGVVDVINAKAINLLKLHGKQVIGNKFENLVDDSLKEAILSLENGGDLFKEIDGITYYLRRKDIDAEQEFLGTLISFRQANEIQQIEYDYRNKTKRKNFVAQYTFKDMVTQNKTIVETMKVAKQLARSNSTILVLGETGTGKEILAQAIHHASPRTHYPFVGVNFAAFSESLLESELFGYEGGAFTGAKKDGRSGLFEQAHKGTVFLDEIGDASSVMQNRLLRVLQEKQIMRVGGEQIISLDLRVIAATNKNLEQLIEEGRFREDLFYRLNVLPIHMPPLRDRVEDIELLTNIFIKEFSQTLNRAPFKLSHGALNAMKDYHWPGNIRELQNTIEYLAHVSESIVYKEHLPFLSNNHYLNMREKKEVSFDQLINNFQEKGFIDEISTMLKFLMDNKNVSLGRHKMLNFLKEHGYFLSEQQFRYRQKLLRDHDLIDVHLGRRGTAITHKGIDFLEYLKKP